MHVTTVELAAQTRLDGVEHFGDGARALRIDRRWEELQLAQRLEHASVDRNRLQTRVVDRDAMHVLRDQLGGLGAESMPQQLVGDARGCDRFVDAGQPPVVVLNGSQCRVWPEALEETLATEEL